MQVVIKSQHDQGYVVAEGLQKSSYWLAISIVVARFRPQNKTELAQGGEPIVEFEANDTCKINVSDQLPFYYSRLTIV
jgi:hypothetical protein